MPRIDPKTLGKLIADAQIRDVPIESLKPAPWNPPIRTKESSMRYLLASMKESGFLPLWPIVYCKGNVIADGNRRHRCAQIIGLPTVPAAFIDADPQELWAIINGTARPTSIRETGQAVARGLEYIPPSHARLFDNLREAFHGDWTQIVEVCKSGASPAIIRQAQAVANYCRMVEFDKSNNGHGKMTVTTKTDPEFLALTIKWLIDKHMAITVRRAIDDGIDPETLLDKVLKGETLKAGWG